MSARSLDSSALLMDSSLDADRLSARVAGENFPVALRLLPRDLRQDLLAVYATARLIDEAGDAFEGDRLRLLDEVEAELDAAYDGKAEHAVFRALSQTLERRALDRGAFQRLIEANRFDQQGVDFARWTDLREYCSLSADPIGELVLQLFDQSTPERIMLSNDVCCALQVIEHCQDVEEDFRAGRCYLPRTDREAVGWTPGEFSTQPGRAALRSLIRLEIERARSLLGSGHVLCEGLSGFARIAVAGFVAGGWAACDALERSRFDPHAESARPRRIDLGRHFLRLYLRTSLGRRRPDALGR